MMYYNIIQERRADPQDDMISDLIAVEVERDGATTKLDDIEITGFASMLGGAGAETVTKLIGNAVVTFAEHPDQWQMLLDDRSKIPACGRGAAALGGAGAVPGAVQPRRR